jgi:hypothetical protein
MYTVDREVFETVLETLDPNCGLEIDPAYPERHHFRTDCIAITGNFPALAVFLFELGRIAEQTDNDDLGDLVRACAWNTFGIQQVVYFPAWAFVGQLPA